MIHIVLAMLLILLGVFPVLLRSGFSQMGATEWTVVGICVIGAVSLLLWKKKSSDDQPQGIHTVHFELQLPAFHALQEGQQLYLRPYLGENHEQIAITNENAEVFGYVPEEYQQYVLSRIESHSMTHTVVEKLETDGSNSCSATINITC